MTTLADSIAAWIREHVDQAGLTGAVIGLSGGLDSATVAGLAARGLGPGRVIGVIMPAHSNPQDIEHARLSASQFSIRTVTVDLSSVYDLLLSVLPPGNEMAKANIKPRLRMITLYQIANTERMMVVGTGNRSEIMVGYFTKYGDGGVDLLPLGSLYKRDVRAVAREIGVPEPILDKPPSAGLWPGQTDEQEMGISYDLLDSILAALDRGDTSGLPPEAVRKVEQMIAGSAHKRRPAPIFELSEPLSMLGRA